MDRILVIAPHADDESLGCGGIILKNKCSLIICAYEPKKNDEFKKVESKCNFQNIYRLNLPDGEFDEKPFGDIIDGLSSIINSFKPKTVFIPYIHDVHSDHRIIAKASLSAMKVFRTPFVKRIYMYETLSQTNLSEVPFNPNVFMDIGDVIVDKQDLVDIYKDCDMKDNIRSLHQVRALARYRGSQAYMDFAEAFMLVREIL